ncbi:hypothetical protein OFY17_09655 [Marinomonas sp. C2222]|uniref:Ricin-type beta-trefoil lectin domain protein n=1 Tax=Marinomonas sargassi TaxID=2984494 RepID=A0ABT2YTB3_9GAMM|nr:hypothetical protein [Marinomonas sargassi]MCV2403141.1 hypothetical protein [Marinomonas sargassi]
MKNLTLKLSVLSVFALPFGNALATAPNVPTEAPYIVLSKNLDEPNGYGFCIDTYGRGQSELMQTHTCKPKRPEGTPRNDSSHDVRFEYKAATQQISSYAFEGQCMQVLRATGKTSFALLECSDHPHQKFVYQESDRTLRLDKDPSQCVVVESNTEKAGPWVKRQLALLECGKVDADLKQWTVVAG